MSSTWPTPPEQPPTSVPMPAYGTQPDPYATANPYATPPYATPAGPYGGAPNAYGTPADQYSAPPYGAPAGPYGTPAASPYGAPDQYNQYNQYGQYNQFGQHNPYGQGAGYYAPARKPGTNGFAVASLIFGIFGGVLLAVIFGHVALSQINKTGQQGRGIAIAGLVLGYAWLVISVIAMLAALSDPSYSTY